MSQASDYLENALINHLFRNSALTSPTTVYCALYTTAPTDAGGGAEINTTGSYSRQSITFGPPLTGSTGNTNILTFGPASTNWGSVTAFGVFDASTSGNLLVWNTLNSPVSISSTDSLQFASGTLQISVL